MGDDAPMPHRVGPHEILLPIATGKTSVFLARGTAAANREGYVAVELIGLPAAADRTFVSTFLGSVTPLCRLRNANVVRMFEAGSDANGAFVVMDYIPGDSLAGLHRLARETGATIPKAIALRVLVDALRGLHAAHELADEGGKPLGLVHGDFSPRNILVGTDGIARVTGFGFSRAPATNGEPIAVTHPQPDGARDDRRADIWAAGVIAWESLTGQKLDEIDRALTTSPRPDPPRVSALASDVPTTLDDVVAQALRLDHEARTATALALADALSDAAKAAGLLASPNEVATYVVRAVGPELVERKALFEDVRRAQRERPPSAPDVRTLIGIAGPLPPKRAPLASLPDVPPPVEDGTSDLRIAIARRDEPADRADEDILGQPIAAPAEDDQEIFRSPLAADVGLHDGPRPESLGPDDVVVAGLPSNRGPLRRVLATVEPWITPPWTTRKISLFAGIGGGLIGFVLVLVAVSGKAKDDTSPSGSSAHGLVTAGPSASPPETPAEVAAKNASSGGPSVTTHAPDDGAQLHIKANGPIASVRVGGRVVDAIVPAPTISVDLEETERDHPLRIVVISTDGRSATATTDPAAATTDVDVTFGAKPTPRPRPRPAPASTVKHPWSKSKR